MASIAQSRTIVSPTFLFTCTLITFFSIATILYWLSGLAYNEKSIPLIPSSQVTEGALNDVKVGLYIENFTTFDVTKDDFTFNGVLSFLFDPATVSLEELKNIAFADGEIKYISDPTTQEEGKLVRAYFHIRVNFVANLNFAWFPFEDHRISLVLMHKSFKSPRFKFVADTKAFSAPDMNFKGWYKFGTSVATGYTQEQMEEAVVYYPTAVFNIDYGRSTNVRNIFMILLPMLMLFFTALFSLIINPHKNFTFVLTFPVSAIAGLISFRFVVESMSPKVGYFMYSDYFFILFLCLIFSILIFHTFGYNIGAFPRKFLIVVFDLMIVLFCFFIVYRIDVVFQQQVV